MSIHIFRFLTLLSLAGLLSAGAPFSAVRDYGKLPLAFEPNRGQADRRVRFLARGSGYSLLLVNDEAVLALAGGKAVVQLQWLGARRQARVEGQDRLPGVSNYFRGSDPAKWQTGIPQFGQVKFSGVYPGIDLVYYGKQRQLEYDVILSPHADPRQLRLRIRGAERIRVSPEGDLVLSVPGGEIFQRKPFLFQMEGQSRRQIQGRYELRAGGEVGFAVASYDPRKPLVIDPVLSYATYLGGTGNDSARGVAVDGSGNAYVTGDATSTDFPTLGNPILQSTRKGSTDVFVAKLNAAGTALMYSTYLGGTSSQSGRGIAVDGNGAAYVVGYTRSTDFPHTPGAFQTGGPAPSGSYVVGFASKLDPTGSTLSYSTFIGSGYTSLTYANAVAVDTAGSAYVAGQTDDTALPTSATAFQRRLKGSSNAFVIKLNAAGTGGFYGTYVGGSQNDFANGIAVDSSGNAIIAGITGSSDFPTQNPIQASNHGTNTNIYNSGFVAKLNANGSALLYSTYLGGAFVTRANAIAADGSGNAYVTGVTYPPTSGSDNFPLQNPLQPALGGGTDAFLTKINAAGNALVYSTYLGGSGDDSGLGVAVDGAGNAYVTGSTVSNDFPAINAFQPFRGGTRQPVLKSLHAGTTWSAGSASEATGAVNTLAVNPVTSSTLYAGTATGKVFQSIDSGAHWSRSDAGLPGAPVSSLAIAASNNATIFAGTSAGVYKSTNGGSFWFAQNSGLTDTTVNAVAVDPSNSDIVYAGTGIGTNGAGYIFMSTNGGGAWAPVAYFAHRNFTSLAIHPVRPQQVYAGTQDGYIVYSFDRFATGSNLYNPNSDVNRVNALAIDPAAEELYAAVVTRSISPGYPQIVMVAMTTNLQCVNGICAVYQYDGKGPGLSVAVSPSGRVFVGRTSSIDGAANTGGFTGPFPAIATDPFAGNTIYIGNAGAATDAFLTVVNPAGTALASSTYFGGSGSDAGQAVAVDTIGNGWLAGVTSSVDFPATAGAKQVAIAGGTDAFVAKFVPSPPPALSITKAHTGDFTQGQVNATYTVAVSNSVGAGATSGTVTVTETIPPGLSLVSMAGTGWTCPAGGTTCTRSDALNGGVSYLPITVTVNVAWNAGTPLLNSVSVSGGGSASSNTSDSTVINANPVPQAVSVTPSTGTGSSNTFSFLYSDANGASDLVLVSMVVNSSLTGYQACYISIDPVHNSLLLLNDGATAWVGSITLPTAGTLANSQCTVNGGSSSIVLSGNNATVNLALSFSGSFVGAKNVYGYAQAAGGLNSGWTVLGNWTVPTAVPQAVSVTPFTGTGSSNTFSFLYSDANGASDLGILQVVVNSSLSGYQGCYISIDPVHKTLLLLNDGATAWQGPITPPTAGTLANSQCTINGGSSSIALSGNNATVNLALSFSGSFVGAKNVYGYAQAAGGLNSGWTVLGNWTVPTAVPQAVSVTPFTGTGSSNTFSFLYSDANGASDLGVLQVVVNSSLSGYQGCYVSIDPVHKTLLLLNDGATAWQGPITLPTSGTLANSQCTINGGSSSIALSGNNATVNLALSFSGSFGGAKSVYGYAQAAGGLNSGWTALGNWTVPAVPPQAVSVTPSHGHG